MSLLIKNCRIGGTTLGSVLVRDGMIARISGDPDQEQSGAETVIDGLGGALFPGLVDSHCHPFEYGWLKRSVDLRGAASITSLRLRLYAAITRSRPGEWVSGMGWDQEAFSDARFPSRSDIDDLSPKNPVVLTRVCGHVGLVNSVAIETLGQQDNQGREYDRDQSGYLTGIVKEGALAYVLSRVPTSAEDCSMDLLTSESGAAKEGLTGLHCIVSAEHYEEELTALGALHSNGSLGLHYRIYLPIGAVRYVEDKGLRLKLGGDDVRINGVKLYADGSLGARTAALREPYEDDPTNTGLLRHSDEELSEQAETADKAGYQVAIHAIGDAAVEQAIKALAPLTGSGNPHRHRIEHASLLPKDLVAKLEKHSIRVSVQPMFITSDTWALKRLGPDRVNDLYPLKSILRSGITASGSSDAPVESFSPVLGIWAAMARGGYGEGQALNFGDALDLYTSKARSNGFDDESSLREGDPADLTLLDSDIEGMHPAMWRKVQVAATIVDGELLHSRSGPEA